MSDTHWWAYEDISDKPIDELKHNLSLLREYAREGLWNNTPEEVVARAKRAEIIGLINAELLCRIADNMDGSYGAVFKSTRAT